MATGKTAVGAICADRLDYQSIDLDEVVCSNAGMSIPELFRLYGEAHFRRLETDCLAALAGGERIVLAAGGGAPVAAQNRKILRASGTVVHLTADTNTILARLGDVTARPLLTGAVDVRGHIDTMLAQRMPIYDNLADFTVRTDGKSIEQVAHAVVATFVQRTSSALSRSRP